MADIKIQDTGKRSVGDSSAQETDKANSGSDIILNAVEITLEQEKLHNSDPEVNKFVDDDTTKMYRWSDIDVTGVDKRKWIVRGSLKGSSTSDMEKFSQLCSLIRTKGYKKLKPHSSDPLHVGGGIIAYSNEADAPLSSINVRVAAFTANSESKSETVEYELQLVEDKED